MTDGNVRYIYNLHYGCISALSSSLIFNLFFYRSSGIPEEHLKNT